MLVSCGLKNDKGGTEFIRSEAPGSKLPPNDRGWCKRFGLHHPQVSNKGQVEIKLHLFLHQKPLTLTDLQDKEDEMMSVVKVLPTHWKMN